MQFFYSQLILVLLSMIPNNTHQIHSDADQGLLLQWAKYEKSDVTIVYYNRLERWSEINPRDHPLIGPIPVTEVPLPRRTKTIGLVDKSIDVVKSCGGSKMSLKRDYHIRECKCFINGGTKRITN